MLSTIDEQKIVEEHFGLAYKIANQFMTRYRELVTRKGLTLEDLTQTAIEELCLCVKRHKPEVSKLTTYAYKSIYFSINELVSSYNQIKIPRWNYWNKCNQVDELRLIGSGYVLSLDMPVNEKEDMSYLDLVEDNINNFDEVEINDLIERILNKEELLIFKMMMQGRTQVEISKELAISYGRVRKQSREIKEKLREVLN